MPRYFFQIFLRKENVRRRSKRSVIFKKEAV